MIGILIAILLAALVYWLCLMLGLPAIVGIVAAILVLLAGVGTGGYGYRGLGGRRLSRPRRIGGTPRGWPPALAPQTYRTRPATQTPVARHSPPSSSARSPTSARIR